MKRLCIEMLCLTAYLTACQDPNGQGELSLCSTLETSEDGTAVHSGQVTAIDDSRGSCARSITITNDDGVSHTVGLTVSGLYSTDITPTFDVELGAQVTLSLQSERGFDVANGFIVTDDDGLIMAADEGLWGGANSDVDLDFEVDFSGSPYFIEKSRCLTNEHYDVRFEADYAVEIAPGTSQELTMDGLPYTAIAVSARKHGPGKRCQITDLSDTLSWVLSR